MLPSGPARHQPGVLCGRLAGHPLPEAGHERAAGHARCALVTGLALRFVRGHAATARPAADGAGADGGRLLHQLAGESRLLAPQVPRLPHAGRGPARAVLLGGGRRHERQRVEVRPRQLPAGPGPGPRLDPQRDAGRRHRMRRRAEPGSGGPRSSRCGSGSATTSRASSGTTARRSTSGWPARPRPRRIGRLGLWATAIAFTALLSSATGFRTSVQNPVTYMMGCVLLLVGVRQSYAKSTAEIGADQAVRIHAPHLPQRAQAARPGRERRRTAADP